MLPPLVQQIAQYLPFQLRIYFPIQLILGKLPPDVIARDFGLQVVWLLIALALFQLVWSKGWGHADLARRTMFGEPVVHGMHAVVWMLERYLAVYSRLARPAHTAAE